MNTQSKPSTLTSSHALCRVACACGLALGCTSEAVDLGGDTLTRDLSRGALCAESTEITQDVLVSNQEELDALAGCEVIHGNLIVRVYADADLTPLASLRVVDGDFGLGIPQSWPGVIGYSLSELLDEELPLLQSGWVESLDGVQALERVGGMYLRGLPDENLKAFERLTSIGGNLQDFSRGGVILQQNYNLRDLTGLENMIGLDRLTITLSPALESLDGLRVGEQLGFIGIYGNPLLTDVSALSGVKALDALILWETALTDLSAFASLETISQQLSLASNAALVDASGLSSLIDVDMLLISGNAALERLPAFDGFSAQPSIITIQGNPELENVTLDFASATSDAYSVEGYPEQPEEYVGFTLGVDVIDIRENASLETISIPNGIELAQLLLIGDNPSLSAVDLGSIQQVDQLTIDQNPNLALVGLGELSSANVLQITDNPQLSPAVFDDVQVFVRDVSGNAD